MLAVETSRTLPAPIDRAVRALARGEPILVFDAEDREGETDLSILSERASPELVRLLRRDAGGYICAAISDELRQRLGLPFYSEMLDLSSAKFPTLAGLKIERLRYDSRSPFGVYLHHRSNYTGIPDRDRAAAIRAVGELARDGPLLPDDELRARFVGEFSSPGHLPILYAAPGLLGERKGHTELVISLARMGGLSESVTVCEMLGDSGGPRDPAAARRYAEDHGFEFLEGRQLIEAWRAWSSA